MSIIYEGGLVFSLSDINCFEIFIYVILKIIRNYPYMMNPRYDKYIYLSFNFKFFINKINNKINNF